MNSDTPATGDFSPETEDLRRQLEQARSQILHLERLDSVGQLAAGVAHEFNNIIGGMRGFAELALSTGDPEVTQQALNVVLDLSERASVITSGLLSLSKKQQPKKTSVDINELLTTQLQLSANQCTIRNIEVVSKLSSVPAIRVDRGQIQQVLLNLVNNAIQSMEEGGILTVASSADDDFVRIEIRDTGHGIAKHLVERIFDPFFTTRGALGGGEGRGTGLGLSVARGIIHNHHGTLDVESVVGEGTSFRIALPAIVASKHGEVLVGKTPRSAPTRTAPAKSVLIVDDEKVILQALSLFLVDRGHEVHTASNADEGLRIFREHRPDLVFLDIIMPGMNGADTYLEMKRINPDLLAAVITGHTGEHLDSLLRTMCELGEIEVFRKPFHMQDIDDFVNRAFTAPLT